MELLQKLQDDMKAALKAGEKQKLGVIRMLLSDVRNIDLAPKPTTAEEVVASYAKKLRKSREEYQKLGKAQEVATLDQEIGIVDAYLPKKASADETQKLVDDFLAGKSYTEKQLGQAMGAFMKQSGGSVDPAAANKLLRERLAGK
jgi:uncharacterized protein YqeY